MEEAASGLVPLDSFSTWNTEHVYKLTGLLYGKIAGWVIVLTLLNNSLTIFNLTQKPNRFTPTCLQYVGISISQTFTVFFQLPVLLHFFNGHQLPACEWCVSYHVLGYVLPSICHMATVWQTVFLGIQRLFCYTWPFRAIPYYRKKVLFALTVSIYLLSVAFHFTRLFDSEIIFTENNNSEIQQCLRRYTLSAYNPTTYHWVNLTVNVYIPCFVLCLLIPLLINTVHNNYRQRIATTSPRFLGITRKRSLRESSVIVFIVVFLVAEIPSGYAQTLHVWFSGKTSQEEQESILPLVVQTRFILYVTYMMHFYVHFAMNYKFRNRMLKRLNFLVRCQLFWENIYHNKHKSSALSYSACENTSNM